MSPSLAVITSAALLDSINPCAVSVLLLTIGFLISLEKSRRHITAIALVYILGIFLTYMLIGLGILQALTIFGIPRAISKFGAVIIIITGLINLAGRFYPSFPIRLVLPQFIKPGIANKINQATIPAAFSLGVLVGLFEFPCTGGPYLFILGLLHDYVTFYSGFTYLIYYNLIFVLPLVIISLLAGNSAVHSRFLAWRKKHSATSDLLSSVAMLILGIIILFLS